MTKVCCLKTSCWIQSQWLTQQSHLEAFEMLSLCSLLLLASAQSGKAGVNDPKSDASVSVPQTAESSDCHAETGKLQILNTMQIFDVSTTEIHGALAEQVFKLKTFPGVKHENPSSLGFYTSGPNIKDQIFIRCSDCSDLTSSKQKDTTDPTVSFFVSPT